MQKSCVVKQQLVLEAEDNSWLLDIGFSCATWHMTPCWDWFCTYEPILEGFMFMGNDHAYEIFGIDTVKLKMYDGTILTIQKV